MANKTNVELIRNNLAKLQDLISETVNQVDSESVGSSASDEARRTQNQHQGEQCQASQNFNNAPNLKLNPDMINSDQLRDSLEKLIKFHTETCTSNLAVSPDHITFHVQRLDTWCKSSVGLVPPYTRCNGWRTYETWLAVLWIENDDETSRFWKLRVVELIQQSQKNEQLGMGKFETDTELASELQSAFESVDLPVSDLYSDLLTGALAAIDWLEIARYLIEEENLSRT
jgi:hypothetical protein